MPGDPFQIDCPPETPLRRAALKAARPLLSWLMGLKTCRELYELVQAAEGPFADRVLDVCGIQAHTSGDDLARLPLSGPLVVAANHPHGALDGLALAAVIGRVRSDVRLLTNHLLSQIPELADLSFFVDPFDGPESAARSRAGLRAAHLWLRRSGSLVVFPAGEVAHMPAPDGTYADSAWRDMVGRLALAAGARVVPAYIHGRNSRWFYAAGRVHPLLRTALLLRELVNKRGTATPLRFGDPIDASSLGRDPSHATRTIRAAVQQLGSGGETIASEIRRLPAGSCLAEGGSFRVFVAEAAAIPQTLVEIGRLREAAYRTVGEGTGRAIDLDRFDEHYLHLFAWDRDRRQVVGAYRIGRTDRIAETQGLDGLYTRTLFKYDHRLLTRLSPALELGRSFVRAEYQRQSNALLLLWKGIGQFVVRHPEYRVLFGPVSISTRYCDVSQRLLTSFLEQNHLDGSLADLVEAVNPHRTRAASARGHETTPASIEDVNRLVAEAEADGKGVPVLLRQYLRLNARLLGFNVDRDFGDALDALMMVDLARVDRAMLNRYLGRAETARFLAHHLEGCGRTAA